MTSLVFCRLDHNLCVARCFVLESVRRRSCLGCSSLSSAPPPINSKLLDSLFCPATACSQHLDSLSSTPLFDLVAFFPPRQLHQQLLFYRMHSHCVRTWKTLLISRPQRLSGVRFSSSSANTLAHVTTPSRCQRMMASCLVCLPYASMVGL